MVSLTYQNANYEQGNQSVLFKFQFDYDEQRYGILVDAGPGLDLEDLLDDDEYILATLLTHAHLDHITSIRECVDIGTPIYATEETTAMLETIIEYEELVPPEDIESLKERLTIVDGEWTNIRDDVAIRPVPVGHAPGACGYVIRFKDQGNWFHMFSSGDFTLHDVAGNPGFDPTFGGSIAEREQVTILQESADGQEVDRSDKLAIGALQMNVPSREASTGKLDAAVSRILERVRNGSPALVATGSLAGIHLASILDHLQRVDSDDFEINLVGKIAAMYEAAGYDLDSVNTVSEFDTPAGLLRRGHVTIAGPEGGSNGSSKALLEAANVAAGDLSVIQLRSAGGSPIEGSWLTSYEFEYSLHPTEDELDEVVTTIGPVLTIINHTTSRSELNDFRSKGDDWESFVYASYGNEPYPIFTDGNWVRPGWISNDQLIKPVMARADRYTEYGTVKAEQLPAIQRRAIDIAAQGIEHEAITIDGATLDTSTASLGTEPVYLDPVVLRLAEIAVADELGGVEIVENTVEELLTEAVDWYLTTNLTGDSIAATTVPLEESVAVNEDTPLATLLDALSNSSRTQDELVLDAVCEKFAIEREPRPVENPALGPRWQYIDAIIANPQTEFQSRDEMVNAAVEAYLRR